MRIKSIVCTSYSSLVQKQIEGLVEYLREQGAGLEAVMTGDGRVIELNIEDEATGRTKRLVEYYIANILYNVLIEEFVLKKLQKHLNERYDFLDCRELGNLKKNIIDTLKENIPMNDTLIYCMNRKNIMLDKICECISENDCINVRGFIDFRYRMFKAGIEECVAKIVEKYIAEKEYNEFINLLKYFVDVQESKLERADIYIDSRNSYHMIDDKGRDMMKNLEAELCKEKGAFDICVEDYVISALITTCPKKIVIHKSGEIKNAELINTIKKVFENRVDIVEERTVDYRETADFSLKNFDKLSIDSDIKV